MAILMPEKLFIAALSSGLTSIKANLTIVDDIFDADILGASYLAKVKTFLTATPIRIAQGFGIDETKLPAWYVVPANISVDESVIGDYVEAETYSSEDTDADEAEGKINRYSLRIISASMNGDVSIFLEAIARYILLSSTQWGETYGLHEMDVTATDFDPIYQYLPQNLFYRSTVATFRGLSSWSVNYTIIKDAELFIKFNPNEQFIEV